MVAVDGVDFEAGGGGKGGGAGAFSPSMSPNSLDMDPLFLGRVAEIAGDGVGALLIPEEEEEEGGVF
jgi:hypothetical protein